VVFRGEDALSTNTGKECDMRWLPTIILVVVCGCSDSSTSGDGVCSPGAVQECPCGESLPNATQVCTEDGSAWGECECGSGDTDTDTDSDSDTDNDTDTDADTGTETDSDACEDVVCDDPPDDHCEEGELTHYTGEATCIEGECHYVHEVTECQYSFCNTAGDNCAETCEEITCTPPDAYCSNPSTLVVLLEPCDCEMDSGPNCYCEYEVFECTCIEVADGDDYCE
jgi:hypothetical protein